MYVAVEREFLRSLVHRLSESAGTVNSGIKVALAPETKLPERHRAILMDADEATDRIFQLAREFAALVT